jgi:PAS domain S-box-containing protein
VEILFEFISKTADGVLAVDSRQRIVLWNSSARRLLGYRAEEVLGKHCYEVLGSTDARGCPACKKGCRAMRGAAQDELVPSADVLVNTKSGKKARVNITTILVPSKWADLSVLVHLFRESSLRADPPPELHPLAAGEPSHTPRDGGPTPDDADLSGRELEVLRNLASGASTGDIAYRLSISPRTVRNHVQHVMSKLNVHSRLEAVALALRHGLL